MNIWVAATLAMIVATTVYSYYKQVSFSIVATVVCILSFTLLLLSSGDVYYGDSETMYDLAFFPGDLTEPSRLYTVLTSMFTHASVMHILFNVLGLMFIGMAFEQRIGTRPYILLFFVTGLCGTLAFAAFNWGDDYAAVVGASGALFGVLGAFARMFPHERMSLIVMFFPLPPMPMWVIVSGFVVLQLVFLTGTTNIAVEAHIGGLLAGMILAPYIAKMPLHKRVRRMVSLNALRRLAVTPDLKAVLRRIEEESIPDVKSAWIEEFLSKATCPHCGARLRPRKEGVMCEKGHML